ncbi:BglG family transcription antiterminator [Luteococcus sp. H154]|uniref:BglG family transcription antiterminator n=1 Tax=Luteococcus sp. H154 TaxID=3139403 RepID=UPI00313D8EF1
MLGNNAALCEAEDGQEVVALGRGLGSGRRRGEVLDPNQVEQFFIAGSPDGRQQLATFLADVPLDCVRAATAIAELASVELGLPVTQSLILPLADHLAFAVQRTRDNLPVAIPLAWEVTQLYPRELAVGQRAVPLASRLLRVALSEDESVAIAMHLVNAQFAGPGTGMAMTMTEDLSRVFQVIEAQFGVTIDRQSPSAARFVTHLRYLFSRVASGQQLVEHGAGLAEAITRAYPEATVCAGKLRYLLEARLETQLSDDEAAYLALHVARLLPAAPA